MELWTSSATHAVLPLLATGQGVRMQLEAGSRGSPRAVRRVERRPLAARVRLPAGAREQLGAAGVRAFCVDQTGIGDPLDSSSRSTPAGAVAVPIDWPTIELVWDDRGYPSDRVYRDYHAHTINGMRAWANGGRPYDRDAA